MTLKQQLKRDLWSKRYRFYHLAEKVGISNGYLSLILIGERTPTDEMADRLARVATSLTGLEYTPQHFTSK